MERKTEIILGIVGALGTVLVIVWHKSSSGATTVVPDNSSLPNLPGVSVPPLDSGSPGTGPGGSSNGGGGNSGTDSGSGSTGGGAATATESSDGESVSNPGTNSAALIAEGWTTGPNGFLIPPGETFQTAYPDYPGNAPPPSGVAPSSGIESNAAQVSAAGSGGPQPVGAAPTLTNVGSNASQLAAATNGPQPVGAAPTYTDASVIPSTPAPNGQAPTYSYNVDYPDFNAPLEDYGDGNVTPVSLPSGASTQNLAAGPVTPVNLPPGASTQNLAAGPVTPVSLPPGASTQNLAAGPVTPVGGIDRTTITGTPPPSKTAPGSTSILGHIINGIS